jgi:PfpI family intracellular protease
MKALIISADLFEDSELEMPYETLKKSGIAVDIASTKKEPIVGKHGLHVEVTMTLDQVDQKQYELLLLPGGKAPAALRKEPKVLEIAKNFFDQNKLVAAICHGPQILISADLMKGRVATGYKSIANELKEAGAIYKDQSVVVDQNLITSREPADLNAFMEAIQDHLDDASSKK